MINIVPSEASELPIDGLAMLVLRDITVTHTDNEGRYLYQYTEDRQNGYGTNPSAYNAIAESVAWLRSQAMIAHKPLDNRADSILVTRWGQYALTLNLEAIRATGRLQDNLHPLIAVRARRQFLLGEYENAIFVSLKAVEVRVRELSGFSNDAIGVALMNQAFKKDGPLADPAAPPGEVQGTMMLFSGAYAVLRNPSGHREVEFDDVTEASEAVMTASLLLRMLDKIECRLKTKE